MSAGSVIVAVDSYRTLASGSISGTYAAVGTPFAHPMRLIKIINTCDTGMSISFDGVADNDFIPAGSFSLYDLCTNEVTDSGWFFRTGTQVYVKQLSAPSSGSVYVIALYGQGE
jgi:curli biogenesis system outer membrane secretion channel CsgG